MIFCPVASISAARLHPSSFIIFPIFPRSAHDATLGLIYFARMTDKMRLICEGSLLPDYLSMIGEGFDSRIGRFLKIDYPAIRDRAAEGSTNEELLE